MKIQIIDDFTGFDGESYFCRFCGRAGFKSVMAVRGHLAACPSRLVKGSIKREGGGAAGGGSSSEVALLLNSSSQALSSADSGGLVRVSSMLQDVTRRLEKVESVLYNELPHLTAVKNNATWWDDKLIRYAVIALFVLLFLQQFGQTDKVGKLAVKAGERVFGKAVDKALSSVL